MKSKVFFNFAILALPLILVIFFLSTFEEQVKEGDVFNENEIMLCKDLSYEKNLFLHPKNFSSNLSLGIAFKSERSWKKNLLNNLIKSEENKKDSDGWRNFSSKSKRYPGTVFLEIPKKFKCKINASIRDHGDLLDQRDGTILPSLNIHLDNGHIFGITKFILFLPHARNGANEIFATELFHSIGLLSPRSMFIDVKYGKSKKRFIFQEKIHKELLESNNFREGPILEGDERFAFWDKRHDQNLSKNKIVNVNWSKKNESSYKISEYSISVLNYLVQLHETQDFKNDNLDYHSIEKEVFNKNLFKDLDVYDALSIAMGSDHTMPRNERRFYFDPLYKKFYPIYYDGMFSILDKNNPFVDNADEMIIPSAQTGSKKAIELLDDINLENLNKNLNKNGYQISLEDTKSIITKIRSNLIKIQNFSQDKTYKIITNNKRSPYVDKNENYDHKLPRKLVFYSESFDKYLKCNIFGDNCEEVNFSQNEKYKLINQELKDKENNHLIFVGKKRIGKFFENWIHENYFEDNKIKKLEKGVSILLFGKPEINLNNEKKIINILKLSENDKIVFFGGILNDWEIEMIDNTNSKVFGIDQNNLTGCLNFYDIEIREISLKFENSNCEDAINFVRTTGSIKKMTINNSAFDAMDADFSNIKFQNININKSLNDCLDFSYGNYEVYNSEIHFCGDKGISVGEASNVKIERVNISNSESGVVAKDFATVDISLSNIFKIKYCFQAYHKKIEFSGGQITSEKNKCNFDHKLASVDISSKLTLNGRNFKETMWENAVEGAGEYNGI